MSGWAGPDLSPLVVHRHTDDLSDVRRWLLRRAENEMVQDSADRERAVDVGNDLERATAAFADERIRLKILAMSRAQLGEQRRFLGCSSSCFWRPDSSDGRWPRTRLA